MFAISAQAKDRVSNMKTRQTGLYRFEWADKAKKLVRVFSAIGDDTLNLNDANSIITLRQVGAEIDIKLGKKNQHSSRIISALKLFINQQ